MDLEDVADELYGVPPEEFVGARTGARDRARAAGDRALAAQIASLPKPSTAAWVCNLLVRERRAEIVGLVELGGMMRRAQLSLSGEQLRELGRQRSQVVTALTRQARGLAHRQQHDVSSAIAEQVEATLRAAVADADAGAALLGGRLTGALSYTGLGPVDLAGAVAAPPRVIPARPVRTAAPRHAGHSTEDDGGRAEHDGRQVEERQVQERRAAERRAAERRAAEERRRQELAQAEQDAQAAAAVARDTAVAADAAAERVAAVRSLADELRDRVAELTDELHRVQQRVDSTGEDLIGAEERRQATDRRAQTAAAIRDRAQERVAQLRAGGC